MNPDDYDEVVGQIYEASHAPTAWPAVFASLEKLVGVDAWTMMRISHRPEEGARFLSIGGTRVSAEAPIRYESHYGALDPRTDLVQRTPPGEIYTCVQHFDERFVSRSEFYQDFLLPEGLRYVIGGCAYRADDHDYVFGLQRGADRGVFTPEDESLLRRLTPHLGRSLRLMDDLQSHLQHADVVSAALDTTAMAVIAIDGVGRVRSSNRRGEQMLRDGDLVCVRKGVLSCADPSLRSHLAAMVEHCGRSPEPVSLLLGSDGSQVRRCSLTLLRAKPASVFAALGSEGLLLCLIAPIERRRVATARQLMALFGLTPAESRLARALAAGESLEVYAENAGLKLPTVKTQLRAVLSKTGTDRQATLIGLIGGVPVVRE